MTTQAVSATAPADALRTRGPQDVARAALVALPFLFPLTAGPSANVWQLLVSWMCVAQLVFVSPVAMLRRSLGLWLVATAGLLMAIRGPDAGLWLPALLAVLVIGLAACVGAGLVRAADERAQAALAWGLLIAGVVSAVLGLLQYYELAEPLVPFTTAPELGQAYGNLRQRNQFATLISLALVAALWLYRERAGSASSVRVSHASFVPVSARSVLRGALVGAMVLFAAAAAASTSRTGLTQWIVILLIAAFISHRERRGTLQQPPSRARAAEPAGLTEQPAARRLPPPLFLLGLIALYFVAAWVLPLLATGDIEDMLRRLREGAPPGHSRVLLWHNVLDLIAAHPWLGVGWGELSFAHFEHLYGGPRFVEILDNAHNLPLHLSVELGVPAALVICGGFAVLALSAKPWQERAPLRLMAWALLGAIVLHSLLEYPLWYGPFQVVFGLCLGLLWPGHAFASRRVAGGASHGVTNADSEVAGRAFPARALPMLAAALLTTAVGYAAWDYTRISQIFLTRAQRLPAWRDNTIDKLQASWLFANQVRFAELTLTPVTPENAQAMRLLALQVVHFSPEPRAIVKLIDACMLLGQKEEALTVMARFKIAFPSEYARWVAGETVDGPPAAQ